MLKELVEGLIKKGYSDFLIKESKMNEYVNFYREPIDNFSNMIQVYMAFKEKSITKI